MTTTHLGGFDVNGPVCLDGRLAWLNNGRGRYHEAIAAAEQGSAYLDDFDLATWAVVELVEAAVRSGQIEKTFGAFGRLCEATRGSESDWAVGVTARCRALISEGSDPEAFYLEAIDRLGRTRDRLELARAHLLYGEWLRREGRRVDARGELRVACEAFTAIGVDGFAERAQRELLATGETVRKRSVEAFDELTPQEAEISRLAGAGYTNPEIGLTMFISNRTVEWHLRKVFTKLGISSRRQLRQLLPQLDVAGVA
jgi:DNA-binding CsgD family transcriptional regulator